MAEKEKGMHEQRMSTDSSPSQTSQLNVTSPQEYTMYIQTTSQRKNAPLVHLHVMTVGWDSPVGII